MSSKPLRTALFIVATVVAASLAPARAFAQDRSRSAPLFDDSRLHRLDLRVHTADWEKLKHNFQENTYYPADFVFDGQTVRNVGIRSRGLGSRSGSKPGLRVDFDRYSSNQSFLGLKSLVLDNLTQDPSGIRETVAMKLYTRLGIPAPREAHARLYVNGNYAGLYVIVESVDKAFLTRTFGAIGDDTQNDGYLYEYEFVAPWRFEHLGTELQPYKERFDAETHEKAADETHYRPIEELVRLVNELPPDRLLTDVNERLDLAGFMRYVAAQNFVAQNDGFLGSDGMNNFYFYRLENSAQHVFIAWDEDTAFWGPEYPVTMRLEENVLTRKAMEVRELREMYYGTLSQAMAIADDDVGDGTSWLEHEIRRQLAMINDAMREDPVRPYTFEQHEHGRNEMISFARQRSRFVHDQLTSALTQHRP